MDKQMTDLDKKRDEFCEVFAITDHAELRCPACGEESLWTHSADDCRAGWDAAVKELEAEPRKWMGENAISAILMKNRDAYREQCEKLAEALKHIFDRTTGYAESGCIEAYNADEDSLSDAVDATETAILDYAKFKKEMDNE